MVTVEGGCVLHAAAQGGRQEVLRAALAVGEQIGVSVNQRDSMGRTPLHSAVAAAQPKLIEMLIAAGAATELSTQAGVTPLGLAVELGEHSCVLALLRAGANSDALTAESVTSLRVAAAASRSHILNLPLYRCRSSSSRRNVRWRWRSTFSPPAPSPTSPTAPDAPRSRWQSSVASTSCARGFLAMVQRQRAAPTPLVTL